MFLFSSFLLSPLVSTTSSVAKTYKYDEYLTTGFLKAICFSGFTEFLLTCRTCPGLPEILAFRVAYEFEKHEMETAIQYNF